MEPQKKSSPQDYYAKGVNDNWVHKEGRACFERVIDKDFYPPTRKANPTP